VPLCRVRSLTFPSALKCDPPSCAARRYVDLNAMIHTALRRAAKRGGGLEGCIVHLFSLIDSAIKKCPPRKSVTLALDGEQ
jgi:5'-3' exonuclease